MNLRILKKLSKLAVPQLLALEEAERRKITHFVSEKGDEGYIRRGGHDRKHWDRSPAVHDQPFNDASIVISPRIRAGTRCPFIHIAPPYLTWAGTPMVGWNSGSYEPEWEEESAWDHLMETADNAAVQIKGDEMVWGPKYPNPSAVLRWAEQYVLAAQAKARSNA